MEVAVGGAAKKAARTAGLGSVVAEGGLGGWGGSVLVAVVAVATAAASVVLRRAAAAVERSMVKLLCGVRWTMEVEDDVE